MRVIKLISLLLVTAMLLCTLASCAKSTTTHVKETSDNDLGFDEGENFPQADYAGEDFTFLTIQTIFNGRDYYGGDFIDAESLTGDVISDAVYKRNLAAEEKYNVNIVERKEQSEPGVLLQQFYMAGDFCFDVIYGWCYKLGNCITNNFFSDFNDLPTADLTAEYWSPSANEGLSINGKLYLTLSDITMNKLEWSHLLFFNKDIYEDYNLESDFGNLYDLVDNGEWTMDTFLNIIQSVSTDVDGDGMITKDDTYGFLGKYDPSMIYCCDIFPATKSDDGSFVIDFYSEKLLDVATKLNSVFKLGKYNITTVGANDGSANDDAEYFRSFFAKGHSLFVGGSASLTVEFRNMSSPYGILPYPKGDQYQEDYVTTWEYNAALFALPSTIRQDVSTASIERTSNVLEYMSYLSNEILLPTYYDTLLKGQRLDGDDDSRMLDIIRTNLKYDILSAIGIYTADNLIRAFLEKPSTITSTYKRREKMMQKEIDDFYQEIINLEIKNTKETEE